MKKIFALVFLSVLFCPLPGWSAPDPSPDPTARVVFLRQNCDVNGAPLENCFESMDALSNLTTGWIWNTRTPSPTAADPLLVDIGPGEFSAFSCQFGGFVTLRGSGRDNTVLVGTGSSLTTAPVSISFCDGLSFISLGMRGEAIGAVQTGVGDSRWIDVEILATGDPNSTGGVYGFLDNGNGCGKRTFHGSRVRIELDGSGDRGFAWTFLAACATTRFFSGEIFNDLRNFTGNLTLNADAAASVAVVAGADFRAYGTTIRALVGPTGPGLTNLHGVHALYLGRFESHGSIVNVTAKDVPTGGTGVNVVAVKSVPGSVIEMTGTAYALNKNPAATATRIDSSAGGNVSSPFLWPPSANPPGVQSQHGSDVFVETDCLASGDCSSTGDEAHVMVYDTTCTTNGNWRNATTGNCRQ